MEIKESNWAGTLLIPFDPPYTTRFKQTEGADYRASLRIEQKLGGMNKTCVSGKIQDVCVNVQSCLHYSDSLRTINKGHELRLGSSEIQHNDLRKSVWIDRQIVWIELGESDIQYHVAGIDQLTVVT